MRRVYRSWAAFYSIIEETESKIIMEYIEAIKKWIRLPNQSAVFLAGGITGCPDWQGELVTLLKDTNYAIFNPRQKNFPINNPAAAWLQIEWEFEYLRKADIISFWFSAEGTQPIVMYELGAWSMSDKPIVVGIESGFWREQDVYIQTSLARPDVFIVDNLLDLANQIKVAELKLIVEI